MQFYNLSKILSQTRLSVDWHAQLPNCWDYMEFKCANLSALSCWKLLANKCVILCKLFWYASICKQFWCSKFDDVQSQHTMLVPTPGIDTWHVMANSDDGGHYVRYCGCRENHCKFQFYALKQIQISVYNMTVPKPWVRGPIRTLKRVGLLYHSAACQLVWMVRALEKVCGHVHHHLGLLCWVMYIGQATIKCAHFLALQQIVWGWMCVWKCESS